MMQRPWSVLLTDLFHLFGSAHDHSPKATSPEVALPTWAGPSNINQENELKLAYTPICWGIFFNWGFLYQNDTTLCHVYIKLAITIDKIILFSDMRKAVKEMKWGGRETMCIRGRGIIQESPSGKAMTWDLRNYKRRFLWTGPIVYINDTRTRKSLGGFRNSIAMWLK